MKDVVTDEMIAIRERRWKKKLPDSFIEFIKQNNGGIPERNICINDTDYIEQFLCVLLKPSSSENGEKDIDVVISRYDEFMVFDGDTLGYDLIPFAQLSHNRLLCLCYDKEMPSIVVWKLEGSEEFKPNYIKCFNSFEEFLEIL